MRGVPLFSTGNPIFALFKKIMFTQDYFNFILSTKNGDSYEQHSITESEVGLIFIQHLSPDIKILKFLN